MPVGVYFFARVWYGITYPPAGGRRETMSIVRFSSDFLMESFTLVDNLFINEHLPYCDDKQLKAYIYGLYLCSAPQKDNSLEKMCSVLGVDEKELAAIYSDFEDAGLCRVVSRQPLEVCYLSLKRAMQPPKKYKSEKWQDFNRELQRLFPERMLTPNEYNEYYSFLDSGKMEQAAMLMIVQYCIDLKGTSVRYPYILTVARAWAEDGVRTVSDVERKLGEYEAQSEDMRAVLAALGRKTGAELEEKQMLQKWTRSWGYTLPAVLAAAASLKGGKSFKRLDARLDEFYRMSVFTTEDIENYNKNAERLRDLAVRINKNLGVYYGALEHVIEVYTVPWTTKGFSDEALVTVAHYCFISGIRTLEGMNSVVNSFFSQGLLTVDAINGFIAEQVGQDERIKAVIAKTGRTRAVTRSDREQYRTWSAVWGFDDEVILLAAEMSAGNPYPSSAINRLLSDWKAAGVRTVADAKKRGAAVPATGGDAPNTSKNFEERDYTPDQFKAALTGIEGLKDVDL